jgi:DNA-binding GntR family transcriptional regulator
MLGQVNDRIRIIRVHDFVAPARVEATVVQHLDILGAILGRKVRVASQRMQAHIEESASLVEDRATKAMLRMLRTPVNTG